MKKFILATLLLLAAFVILPVSLADGPVTSDFEPTLYHTGNINGQDGWLKTGFYDVNVVENPGVAGFGTQTLSITSGNTSGSFGDQTFSKGLVTPAGETNADGTVTPRLPHFDGSFDFFSSVYSQGLHVSISPDRGDGARMSYLRFEDDTEGVPNTDGVHVIFSDVTGTNNPANFNEVQVATLTRGVKHTIRFSMNFLNGPSNDVVYIYVDGVLTYTGTSWENYYRYDTESNPGLANDYSRTVDKLLFRESGTAWAPTGAYLIDNVSLTSGPLLLSPTDKDQCKKGGWSGFNNPAFKNQGDCVSYVVTGK